MAGSAGPGPAGRICPRALGRFVRGLERGLHVVEAAKRAGVAASTFYRWRKRWRAFAEAWDAAVEKSNAPMLIAAGNGRRLQKRKSRRVRFTRERKERFLAHFAATCDASASAEEAGVCSSTVWKHLAKDAAFAEGYSRALEIGYLALEGELVAAERAAREAYRIVPDAEALARAPDFDKAVRLLELWRRKDGKVGRRDSPVGDPRMRWSFDEAMVELEKHLSAFGVRISDQSGTLIGEGEQEGGGGGPG